ncbi:hypothetical protein SG34_000205 [Thalassomonas viridans]|uniref:Uncharacterized protein n=1 Tax=Thalassomonas viridans TaxID=137584 RepID=A0AAE9Z2G6_9GAMM|nr:hypothetical protein [Thalassomonas viridans]WDE05410.1 hypothetical protein SG34_000205 [Thalassomonas viridans]
MKKIAKTLAGLALVWLLPFGLMANEVAADAGFVEAPDYAELALKNCGCEEAHPICDDVPLAQAVAAEPADTDKYIDPIFVDGVLYRLSKGDFAPIYTEREFECEDGPYVLKTLVGYGVTVPVEGDIGQELIFDINGRSTGKNMNLSVSCGSFNGRDYGDKYNITRQMTTNGTCTSLEVKLLYFTGGLPPQSIELTVLIADPF